MPFRWLTNIHSRLFGECANSFSFSVDELCCPHTATGMCVLHVCSNFADPPGVIHTQLATQWGPALIIYILPVKTTLVCSPTGC